MSPINIVGEVERYLTDKDIFIRKRVCQNYMVEGVMVPNDDFSVIDYTVSMRTADNLKTAYVKLGNVLLGWFKLGLISSTSKQGIYIEEKPLPEPFEWKQDWPSLNKLVDYDTHARIEDRIEEEFGIRIGQYLGAR